MGDEHREEGRRSGACPFLSCGGKGKKGKRQRASGKSENREHRKLRRARPGQRRLVAAGFGLMGIKVAMGHVLPSFEFRFPRLNQQ